MKINFSRRSGTPKSNQLGRRCALKTTIANSPVALFVNCTVLHRLGIYAYGTANRRPSYKCCHEVYFSTSALRRYRRDDEAADRGRPNARGELTAPDELQVTGECDTQRPKPASADVCRTFAIVGPTSIASGPGDVARRSCGSAGPTERVRLRPGH